MLYAAYGIYSLTLAVGLGFFWTYDRKRSALPKKWLVTHIFLAVLTFIAWTSALSGFTWQKPAKLYRSRSPWSNYLRHEQLRRRYQRDQGP